MLIKIKGRNERQFNETVESVMNIACVVAGKGSIPSEYDIKNAVNLGKYWYENVKEDMFDILGITNDHKAFVRERGVNFIVIEFSFRYDARYGVQGFPKKTALSNLILAIFNDDEVELVVS
jgi:hypothetical protein